LSGPPRGNLLSDTFNTYTWDPNWGNPSSINGNVLQYDALGRMVENTTSAGIREYLYGPNGSQPLAQMNAQTPVQVQYPLPGGGLAIYKSSNLTYARTDWLGSARLVTNGSQGLVNDSAYAPFGEQYSIDNIGFSSFYDFTGQQQWTVSGSSAALDDFPFRKYHPVQGRWITPAPAGMGAVDITNPQTWNRYAYVGNNPLSNIDPAGLNWDSGACDEFGDCNWDGDCGTGWLCPTIPVIAISCCGTTTTSTTTTTTTTSGQPPPQQPINFPNETLGLPNGFPLRPWGILPALFPSDLPCPAELSSLCAGINPFSNEGPLNTGPGPGAVAASFAQYASLQASNCYNGFHKTTFGKVTQAFSATALLPVATNSYQNRVSLGAEVLGKFSVVAGSNSAGGLVTPLLEQFTARVSTPAFILGTAIDTGVLAICYSGKIFNIFSSF